MAYNFSLNNPAVQKAIRKALEIGKYSTVITQTVTGKDREWVIYFSEWLKKHDVIGPYIPDSSLRELKCKSYEEVESRINKYNLKDSAYVRYCKEKLLELFKKYDYSEEMIVDILWDCGYRERLTEESYKTEVTSDWVEADLQKYQKYKQIFANIAYENNYPPSITNGVYSDARALIEIVDCYKEGKKLDAQDAADILRSWNE